MNTSSVTWKEGEHITTWIHHTMAVVGGYMGGYAILSRASFFGNAQTVNLITLVHSLLGQDLLEAVLRLSALLLYIFGTFCYVMVKNKTGIGVKRVALGIDLVAFLWVGFVPTQVKPVVALMPIFFAMSFQWNSFPGNYGYVSSTIFSTNNVKQTTLAFSEYLCDRDRNHLHKMWFFLGSLIGFHTGVALSYLGQLWLGSRSIWLNIVLVIIAGILTWKEELVLGAAERGGQRVHALV